MWFNRHVGDHCPTQETQEMAYKKPTHDAAFADSLSEEDTSPVSGFFEVEKITYESIAIRQHESRGSSFGALLDGYLGEALRKGEVIRQVTLQIDSDAWRKMQLGNSK
jgi:hypothetical protein